MKKVKLSSVKRGGLLKFKDTDSATVWVKNHYDRESKTFSLTDYYDTNREIFRKGSNLVLIDFTF